MTSPQISAMAPAEAKGEHSSLDAFADSSRLTERLNSARIGSISASVVVMNHGQLFVASRIPGASEVPTAVSCIAKAMTGALVGFAVLDGKLRLDDLVIDVLDTVPDVGAARACLAKMTIRHLMTHTDGLDDPDCASVPTTANGFIDVQQLCERLFASPPLASPGTIYRYSSNGPWLAAAILERLHGETYLAQVERRILGPVGVTAKFASDRRSVCPSDGGDLQLSARDLANVAALFFCSNPQRSTTAHRLNDVIHQCSYPLPSWPQTDGERVSLGWISHGAKGLGHFGTTPSCSVMFRVFPEISAAVAIVAAHPLVAYRLQQHIFGATLSAPANAAGCMLPRALTSSEWEAADESRYVGDFRNSRLLIRVDVLPDPKTLRATIYPRMAGHGEPVALVERQFVPACEHMFYPTPSEPKHFPMLQFTHPASNGAFTVLNTGRSVLARCESV